MNNEDSKSAQEERASMACVIKDAKILNDAKYALHVLQAIPSLFMILNEERQIIYSSHRLTDLLGAGSDQEILGKRPGEILNCKNAYKSATGCGTMEICRECGAMQAIRRAQKERHEVEEVYMITSAAGHAYDFRVWASPFPFEDRYYTLLKLTDISDEKRRQILERTFFHDVRNIVNVIQSYSSLVKNDKVKGEISNNINTIQAASKQLCEEIGSHMKIIEAEDGVLAVNVSQIDSLSILKQVMKLSCADDDSRNMKMVLDENSTGIEFTSDDALLRRVLRNMLNNALEASPNGGTITLGCERSDSSIIFSVHNSGFIPRSVQLQIFLRSFSTKGKGRGLGTYSMKLFGEQYLKGQVWFSTAEDKGTTFFISIPICY